MRGLSVLLRMLSAAVLMVGLSCGTVTGFGRAHAANYETLMVPSAAIS